MIKKHSIVPYVKDRFKYLYSLKAHRFPKYWKYRAEYAQLEQLDSTSDGYTNYYMNTWFALANSKKSEIFTSTPQYDFVWLDENGRKYKKLVERLWQWVWLTSNTDDAIAKIITDACTYWTWFWREVYSRKSRIVNVPDPSADEITFIEKEIIDYEGCELIRIDWANTYVNWSSMDNCTEAIVVTHWDKDEFEAMFGNWMWDISKVRPWKCYYTNYWDNKISWFDMTDRTWDSSDNSNTVSVMEYWNKYRDEYIVIANDIHINQYKWGIMPNPNPHKDIPIVMYTDHQIDWDIYWRGEYDITEKSRLLKNDSRSLMIETIKVQWGIITIDPASDFDETVERIWLKQFARVSKDDLWFYAPSISVSPLELLEKRIDEDIIIETWVDFKAQLFWPRETSPWAKWRIEASKKRINSNIKENAYSFYKRLANLRIENIKTYYKGKSDLVPVRGYEISSNGSQESIGNDYGTMEITKDMLSWKILLLPIVDSIFGETSKTQRTKYFEMFQILINLKKSDWSPLIEPSLILDAWRWIIDDVIDLDKVLWSNASIQDSLNKELESRGLPNPMKPQGSPQWIPPAQQSWRAVILPSSAANQEE